MKSIILLAVQLIFVQTVLGSCVATIYYNDPLLNAIGLHNGTAATTWDNWQLYNAGDDLDSSYVKNNLTIAPEGGRLGAFVNLGTEQSIVNQYNVQSYSHGSIYMSIHYEISNQMVKLNFVVFFRVTGFLWQWQLHPF